MDKDQSCPTCIQGRGVCLQGGHIKGTEGEGLEWERGGGGGGVGRENVVPSTARGIAHSRIF